MHGVQILYVIWKAQALAAVLVAPAVVVDWELVVLLKDQQVVYLLALVLAVAVGLVMLELVGVRFTHSIHEVILTVRRKN